MAAKSLGEMMKVLSSWEWSISCWMRIVWNFKSIWVVAVVLFYFKKEWNDINKATADFMLEQPWLSLFFYPYKRDCSADYGWLVCAVIYYIQKNNSGDFYEKIRLDKMVDRDSGNARHCVGNLCGSYNRYLGIWCIYLPADCDFRIGLWYANRDAGTE